MSLPMVTAMIVMSLPIMSVTIIVMSMPMVAEMMIMMRLPMVTVTMIVMSLPTYVGGSCLLYTSPSPRDKRQSRMPSSA